MPPAKRQRISRACEPCRKRKSKCDGEQPSCLMCQSAGRKCMYPNSTKRRGLQSGYVRGLETLLGLIVRCHPETEVQIEKLLRQQEARDCLQGGHDGETCIHLWRTSPSFKRINSVIQQQSSDFEDDAVDSSALRRPHDSDRENTICKVSFTQRNAVPTPHTNSTCGPTGEESESAAFNTLDFFDQPFPPQTIELMEHYFTFTHSWFPILERQKLLKVMHGQAGSMAHDRQVIDLGYRMSLWALIAYTLAARAQSSPTHTKFNSQGLEMRIRARAIFDDEDFSLGHVQAFLILILLRLKYGHLHAAWVMVAQAVRMIDILGRRPQSGRYRQVFQGCVILDNFISTLLDRSPCLSCEELENHTVMKADVVEEEEGLDEWDVWTLPPHLAANCKKVSPSRGPLRALSTFRLTFELMRYSSKFSDHRINEQGDIDSYLQQLQDWRLNLPAHCKWTDSPESMKPPVLILHLFVNFVMSTLLKRRCSMDMTPVVLCSDTAKFSADLLDNYIQMTGMSRMPPLFVGFGTHARKLFELSMLTNADEASVNASKALERIMESTSCSDEPDDRGIHWKEFSFPDSAISSHAQIDNPSTYQFRSREESNIYSECVESAGPVDYSGVTGEVPFEALCEQIVAAYPSTRDFPDPSFARNLGFMDDLVDEDLLSFLDQPISEAV